MATKTQYYNLDKPSYDEVADIEVINANFDKIDQQMRNNADGVNFAKAISSDAYDNSKLYAVGDYCIYDNKLYRCITAIESAEAFNIAKWEQTTVGKEVKQLNSNLTQLEYSEYAGGKNKIDISKIQYDFELDLTGQPTTKIGWYVTDYLSVKPSTKYVFSGISSKYAYEFDENKQFVKISTATSGLFETSATTKFIRLNSIIDGYSTPQLEEGTTATPYEPFIPSVKMLAEKTTQIDDLNVLGWVVPEEMPIKNYVDSNGVFHQRVGRVDLGSLDFTYVSGSNSRFACSSLLPIAKDIDNNVFANAYCHKYTVDTANNIYKHVKDKTINVSNSSVWIYDTTYTDVESFNNAIKGVYLYYELATENTIKVDGNEVTERINDSLGAYAITNDMLEIGHWWNGGNTSNEHIRVKKEYSLQSGFKGYVTNNTEKQLSIIKYNEDAFVGSVTEIEVGKTILVEVPSGSNYRMYEVETDFSKIASNIIVATNGLGKEVAEIKNDLMFKNVWSGEIYKANETATISNFSNSKKYLFEFKAKSNAYKQNVIVLGNQVYIEVPLIGHASTIAFTLYRLNISSNGVVTISDVINEDSGASLVNIYEI